MTSPNITLSNGVQMPMLGLGTWQATEGAVAEALRIALRNGYRHIDTAAAYANEAEIGIVLQEFFKSGELKREDVFIVTKLFWGFNREEHVEPQLRNSLKSLQLDFVDLYLVHIPGGVMPDLSSLDNEQKLEQVWRGMEKVYDMGLTRAIGVSNANAEQIERVMRNARVPIHNNQVECHIYFNQKQLQAVQKRHNISMTAYAAIGSPGRSDVVLPNNLGFSFSPKDSSPLLNPIVKRLATKYGKTPAQILLRQLTQRGICVIPKSTNEKRLLENGNIFDFALTDAEVKELLDVEQGPRIFKFQFLVGSHEDPLSEEERKQQMKTENGA